MSFPHFRHDHRSTASLRTAVALLAAACALALAPLGDATVGAQGASPASAPGELLEFTILIFERPADLARRGDSARADAYWTAYDDFAASLAQAGALRGGSALSEHVALTVRGEGSADRGVPSARLGGYFVIAAPDLAAARALAGKAPAFAAAVEVRPHRPNPHMAAMSGGKR